MKAAFTIARRTVAAATLRHGIVAVVFATATMAPARVQAATATVGMPPPAFALRDENGKVHRIADYVGNPTIIYFTHNVCHYCTQVIAFLERAHATYADKDLVILTINVMADGGELIRRYKEQFDLSFAMLAGKDPDLLRDYEVNYVPIMVFIDRRGVVTRIDHHYILPEDFDASVAAIVNDE